MFTIFENCEIKNKQNFPYCQMKKKNQNVNKHNRSGLKKKNITDPIFISSFLYILI